jgi:hypothetical protein
MNLSPDQVLAFAPDSASAAAARTLAAMRYWRDPGRSDAAVWGTCQGSALYQVAVDLTGPAWKCSCPSRKIPCKHALGLMLFAASTPEAIPISEPPPWTTEWLDARARTAARRESKRAAAPPDSEAQSKRAAQRFERVREGIDGLELWMQDLVRHGLAAADPSGGNWDAQAARLVDAQAPALASRVRGLAYVPRATADWAGDLLAELGRIAFLTEAFRNLDTLDEPLRADVRQLIGWTTKEDEVVAAGDMTDDDWIVLGQATDEDERFRSQRTYLSGQRSRRSAMVLQFAASGEPFAETLLPGTHVEAVLAFWPGAAPLRALVHERRTPPVAFDGRLPGFPTFAAFLDDVSTVMARQPWTMRLPCVVCDVVPTPESEETWWLQDKSRDALPLAQRDAWPLLAISGGHPIDVMGEWDGRWMRPLFAWSPRDNAGWSRPAR